MSLFRELFVEVPQALLDAAEEALRAKLLPPAPTLLHDPVGSFGFIIDAASRFLERCHPDVRVVECERSAVYKLTYVRVKLACGHRGLYTIDETELQIAGSFADYLWELFEQPAARKCCCLNKSLAGCAFFDGLTYHDRCKGCQ